MGGGGGEKVFGNAKLTTPVAIFPATPFFQKAMQNGGERGGGRSKMGGMVCEVSGLQKFH